MNDKQSHQENFSNISELSYEQAISELEKITSKLESDQNTLEEAVHLFEHGQLLITHCVKLLDQAELRVQQLIGEELLDFPNNDDR